jgi:hypothetical protein
MVVTDSESINLESDLLERRSALEKTRTCLAVKIS